MLPVGERDAAGVRPAGTACCKSVDGVLRVRLPRSTERRGTVAYIQVLHNVEPRAGSGFGFDGPYFRCGKWIQESELCAGRDGDAIAVECAEVAGAYNAERQQRRWEAVYIVWRYHSGAWSEVARTSGERALVVPELRAIAERALGQRAWRIVPSVAQAAERIRDALERQLAGVEPAQRPAVLAILHDEVVARMVEE